MNENESEHRNALPNGYRFHEYRIDGVLGVGGFGITYLGWDESLQQRVAIKEYLPNEIAVRDGKTVHPKSTKDLEDFEWGRMRFVEEARILVNFHHTNIVRVYRLVEDLNKTAYMVMSYEDGASLEDLLTQRDQPPCEETLRDILFPLLDGVEEVHKKNFLHRDIKPGNIFIRKRDESPVLLDFGSARQALGGRRSRSLSVVVSAGYAPIEQYESDPKLQKEYSDIYSLGGVLYRAIGGETPAESTSRSNAVYARGMKDPLIPAVEVGKGRYSVLFLRAIDHALAIREKDRPQNIAEWRKEFTQDSDVRSGRLPEKSTRSGLRHKIQAVAGLALLGAGIWWGLEQWMQTNPGLQECDTQAAYWGNPYASVLDNEGLIVPERALPACRKAVSSYPAEPRFKMQLARVFIRVLDYAEAIKWLQPLAEQGYAPAQLIFGSLHLKAKGMTRNEKEAFKWFNKAAEQNYVIAYYFMGNAYRKGEGVEQSDEVAEKWFKRLINAYQPLAEKGDRGAQFVIGVLTLDGFGTAKSVVEGETWLRKAADLGDLGAQADLGLLYIDGRGVKKDEAEGIRLVRKVAEQGSTYGQFNLGYLYFEGKGVSKNASEAMAWLRKAVAQEYGPAQAFLGHMFLHGIGVDKPDERAGINLLRKAMDQGEESGYYNLASAYLNGNGVPKDEKEALRLYRKAAELGYQAGRVSFGDMLANGQGGEKNLPEAVKWYRKAAEQDYADGQFRLGELFEEGMGVEKSYSETLKWYTKAATQNHALAQYKLGILYLEARGVEKNGADAVQWLLKAAEQNVAAAQSRLGMMYLTGDGVGKDGKEAEKWLLKASENGQIQAQLTLGVQYFRGELIKKDVNSAFKWIGKSAELGNTQGQYNLANMYFEGLGTEKNHREAIKWYRKAADNGLSDAQNMLGMMYLRGHGTDKNVKLAVEWFRKAAQKGNALAMINMANQHLSGDGVEKDDREAFKLLRMAADQGHVQGQYWVGVMYEHGRGVPKDESEALKWYRKSADQGDNDAKNALKRLQNQQSKTNNQQAEKNKDGTKPPLIKDRWEPNTNSGKQETAQERFFKSLMKP
ncbi:MAG: serine/threonine-protein kinase [Magnetococcus sp. YQC-9]